MKYSAKIDQVLNRLTVKAISGKWLTCQCICGASVRVRRDHAIRGLTKSCGCLAREKKERVLRVFNARSFR